MEERTILHCDLNNFFASVECLSRPDLKARPVAVCGDPEKRHGIILAKNDIAKRSGVKTGEPIVTARAKCRGLILLPAHYGKYTVYSNAMRDFYRRYTDRIESFGIDECWLDVSESASLAGDGVKIANELRALARSELGLTVSAGISFNKFFAKMGSDYKKPDASTHVTRENFRELLWPLPVEDMLFVGRSTAEKLRIFGIDTIGGIANADPAVLGKYFGKPGLTLRERACGVDPTPVAHDSYRRPPESVGNTVTCPRDVHDPDEARTVLYMLCDSVATRLRRHGMRCRTLTLHLRFTDLSFRSFRAQLAESTELASRLFETAYPLFLRVRDPGASYRGFGVTAQQLVPSSSMQLSFLDDSAVTARREQLEKTVDALRARYGIQIIGGALCFMHPDLTADHPLGHRLRPGNFDDSAGFPGEAPPV
ncbi:MAG: DNA polymerase IV [Clostridia bacterium]|nr:DNA polymerase IV [Clostridia bacterium]